MRRVDLQINNKSKHVLIIGYERVSLTPPALTQLINPSYAKSRESLDQVVRDLLT